MNVCLIWLLGVQLISLFRNVWLAMIDLCLWGPTSSFICLLQKCLLPSLTVQKSHPCSALSVQAGIQVPVPKFSLVLMPWGCCPANLFERLLVPQGIFQPWCRKLPISGEALGAWLQNDCPSDESIPESNLCLLLCPLHKAMLNQSAFVFYRGIAVLCVCAALYPQDLEGQHKF